MEVHHHAHSARKKWTHYFWEFLMLFLAVFCGFLAEYQLEHMIEKEREGQYMSSLVTDLQEDVDMLKQSFNFRKRQISRIDSLIDLLGSPTEEGLNDMYYYSRFLGRSYEFYHHNRTISQLLNSGNFRLIRKRNVADSIMIYNNIRVQVVLDQQDDEIQLRKDLLTLHLSKLFDAQVWNKMTDSNARIVRPPGRPALMTNDPLVINGFVFQIVTLRTTYQITNNIIQTVILSAENLMDLIRNKYNLK